MWFWANWYISDIFWFLHVGESTSTMDIHGPWMQYGFQWCFSHPNAGRDSKQHNRAGCCWSAAGHAVMLPVAGERPTKGQLERRHQLDPTQDMNGYEGYLEFHDIPWAVRRWRESAASDLELCRGTAPALHGRCQDPVAVSGWQVDVKDRRFQNGTLLQIYDCIDNDAQKLVSPIEIGHTTRPRYRFQFANKKDGSYFIDVPEASAKLWKQLQICSQFFNAWLGGVLKRETQPGWLPWKISSAKLQGKLKRNVEYQFFSFSPWR